jgi:tRNA(adenine34) deaminase
VVLAEQVIGRGYNRPIGAADPSAHAEMIAIREAAARLGNYRLPGCELFVTLEPCAMCAGVIQHARIARLVFAASDPKTGACGSVTNLFTLPRLTHHATVSGGVLGDAAGEMLRAFFAARRGEQRRLRAATKDPQHSPGAPQATETRATDGFTPQTGGKADRDAVPPGKG